MKTRMLRVLWPAFLAAAVLDAMVFAVVDPGDLRWFGGPPIGWSPLTIYSVTFLIFWLGVSAAGMLTLLLSLSADEINAAPPTAELGEPGRG